MPAGYKSCHAAFSAHTFPFCCTLGRVQRNLATRYIMHNCTLLNSAGCSVWQSSYVADSAHTFPPLRTICGVQRNSATRQIMHTSLHSDTNCTGTFCTHNTGNLGTTVYILLRCVVFLADPNPSLCTGASARYCYQRAVTPTTSVLSGMSYKTAICYWHPTQSFPHCNSICLLTLYLLLIGK